MPWKCEKCGRILYGYSERVYHHRVDMSEGHYASVPCDGKTAPYDRRSGGDTELLERALEYIERAENRIKLWAEKEYAETHTYASIRAALKARLGKA